MKVVDVESTPAHADRQRSSASHEEHVRLGDPASRCTPVVLFVVLFFMGVVAFIRLPINQNPDISFPYVIVGVSQPGAAPPEIETQIMQKVEGAVANVGGVKHIQSTAMEGQANIGIEFQIGTPVDRAVIGRARCGREDSQRSARRHPGAAVVQRIDVEGGAIVYYAVEHHRDDGGRALLVRRQHRHQAAARPSRRGAGTRGGGVNREIRIELDPARMQALGLTAVNVNRSCAR